MKGFVDETERVLRTAGWHPDRRIDISAWEAAIGDEGYIWNAAAIRFLTEFGELKIDASGPGITCAREPFEFNPTLAEGESDRFTEWSELVGESITPVGDLDSGRYFLGISESGDVYLVADWLANLGKPADALESLVLGRLPTPIDPL